MTNDSMTSWGDGLRQLSVDRWGESGAVEMLGRSAALVSLQTRIAKIAKYREPVLITGESGAGKEQVARALYLLGFCVGQPYVSVNCPQYQDGNLTVSELFGHRRGSFTGATGDRKGAFEQAHGGVIFLDEIGDLHPGAQAMLLRALSTGEYRPIGANHAFQAEVHVLAATNRPLNRLMLAEEFRNDLFFRLRQFHLDVPALRQRENDWEYIADHLLRRLAAQYGVSKSLSGASIRYFEHSDWPGNVRQLVSVVRMGYAIAESCQIEPDDFASEVETDNSMLGRDDDTVAAELFARCRSNGGGFWDVVYPAFMDRELNRGQVRRVIRRGLSVSRSYRRLVDDLRMPRADYQRFMDFLRHHRLKP